MDSFSRYIFCFTYLPFILLFPGIYFVYLSISRYLYFVVLQLVAKLEESGWKEQVKGACKDVVKERGLDKITVEDLVQVTPTIGSISGLKSC